MQPNDILDLDATGLVEAYRAGRLLPSQALEAYIAQQERVNPELNLVVARRYHQARQEARACDQDLALGRASGSLFGVPFTVKESMNLKGLPITGALDRYASQISQEDAVAVARIKAAGAVFMAKTNTPALCFCQETDSLLYGPARNPWDPDRTTGGSSGGEGGLVAVGGTGAGLGADIGGSIRIPSHFNGVVGFMPGAHQSSGQGHFPDITDPDQVFMLGIGPLVKSVRDAALVYSVLQPEFTPPATGDLPDRTRVISFGSFHKTRCTPETEGTLERAGRALQEAGLELVRQVPEFMTEVALAWQLTMSIGRGRAMKEVAYPGRPNGVFLDWLRAKLGLAAQCHPYLSWALIGATLFGPGPEEVERLRGFRRQGLEQIRKLLGDRGVFLTPVLPYPALPLGRFYADLFSIRRTFRWVLPFVALGNFFGLPSLVVPCGFTPAGLPIGLQVSSLKGNEDLVFRVGTRLESALGGYRRCSRYDAGGSGEREGTAPA